MISPLPCLGPRVVHFISKSLSYPPSIPLSNSMSKNRIQISGLDLRSYFRPKSSRILVKSPTHIDGVTSKRDTWAMGIGAGAKVSWAIKEGGAPYGVR